MSKIGKLPVEIKEGVSVVLEGSGIKVTGSKGSLSFAIPEGIHVVHEDGKIIVTQKNSNTGALFGLVRATIANMAQGVQDGFEKKLELSGVGYRAQVSGNDLVLSVGYSHPVRIKASDGITFTVVENLITIAGADISVVGNLAAKIRAIRPPEPYKGKGILYKGEKIRRKAGKSAKAVGVK